MAVGGFHLGKKTGLRDVDQTAEVEDGNFESRILCGERSPDVQSVDQKGE
jgi:hypothetical protein